MNIDQAIKTIEQNLEFIVESKGRPSKLPKLINTIYLETYYFNACLKALTCVKFNKNAVIKAAKKIERAKDTMIVA
tara:strand:+ start:117 stop:344 length:228 start_codon:yes stop_codon:yes gene_type:complete